MSHVGRLLVATPLIADPSFERTVVLLLAHGVEGAFGVVVNRPSDTPVVEVADEWVPHVAAPGVVFLGGPVGGEAVVGLARRGDRPDDHFGLVAGDLGTIDLHRPPEPGEDAGPVRLFAGSAGWTSGQLEDEVAEGAWWPVDGGPDDVLGDDPAGLWARVLRRQPGQVAWFANHPHDPTAN
ncbi:MAG TPA: YqgE/AlgH family protein [Aquihabitans sp.]|jgi:putative transcriptional regulator|nr:YqgE/AlgH family protein [Aquihabitans sp.]